MSRNTLVGLIVLLLILGGIVWLTSRKADKEASAPVLSVSAFNQTKNTVATSVAANPNDVIVYTINAENKTDKVVSGYIMEANIADISGKVTLTDTQGASYNSATNSLVWTPLDIPANGSISKQFSARVNPLPAGTTNSVLKTKFNNELDISIVSSKIAGTATNNSNSAGSRDVSYKAPKTGPSASLVFWLALAATAGVFIFRKFRLKSI